MQNERITDPATLEQLNKVKEDIDLDELKQTGDGTDPFNKKLSLEQVKAIAEYNDKIKRTRSKLRNKNRQKNKIAKLSRKKNRKKK